MRFDLIEEYAREIMDRPTAHMGAIETLRLERDGFAGVRVEMYDTTPLLSGKNKGRPNWRKATNKGVRQISDAELDTAQLSWIARTGLCPECAGSGEVFFRWSIDDGLENRPCKACHATGKHAA